ncbi:putative asparaginase [Vibrio ichthyoenteri ATCC 700023]|uniref:Isoaspartyl peptidase n=1 Tax=Vibrio ichthyoenteri ATCC 700023 TaxID=870968 RepID=F9S8L9_9VIBR|nr:isoaspartyl peptidase/L-asparaginase [Vibrio ichthyoenteri]EGU29695.1 putative asparaginase [Vibrio ichthyoenteri ATCC 700023]
MTVPFAIAIHGGAGTILAEQMSAALENDIRAALQASVTAGHQILSNGGDALDAVVAAVKVLEDCEHFNAGKGSVLTAKEMVEMDASVMHGLQMQVGAIAGVRHIKNPIELARDVMLHSSHAFLVGEGAEEFAFQQGHLFTEQDYFFTDRRYDQLMALKESDDSALSEANYPDDGKHGTVGAVALDQQGNLAAATSTGGIANKRFGRVGDSAVIGAGTLAENGNVAISSTGVGELFIRKMVASDIAARMRYLGEDVQTACETVIQGDLKTQGGEGGVIAIDKQGAVHFALNCLGMYRASIDIDGKLSIKIFADG